MGRLCDKETPQISAKFLDSLQECGERIGFAALGRYKPLYHYNRLQECRERIGIHALKAVPKEQGKRGGGLAAYAERIGKSKQYVGQIRQAAEVLSTCKLEFTSFMERSKHVNAIAKLPRPCWQAACEWLAENEASVADVEAKKKIQTFESYRKSVAGGSALRP